MGTQQLAQPRKERHSSRNYETLPDLVWGHIATKRMSVKHILPYVFLRWWWRPSHWDPRASAAGQVEELRIPVSSFMELLGLSRKEYRLLQEALEQATGHAGNPLAQLLGGRGRSDFHAKLWSIYRRGQLLDKHWELDFGHFDPVHHGLLLPFGNIQDGQVTRYIVGPEGAPLLTLEAAGIFLWLLYMADRQSIQEGWLEGEGFAQPRAQIHRRREEVRYSLHISLQNHAADLDMLARLGWIRPQELPPEKKRRPALDCLVTEAPADMLELAVLAIAAHRDLPFSRASGLVDEISQGKLGIHWVLHGLEDLRWSLTPEGEELLRIEIVARRSRAATFEPRSPTEEAIRDTIYDLGLPDDDLEYLVGAVDQLIARFGENWVWDVVWNARRLRPALQNPVGWITSALQAGPDRWNLQRAPATAVVASQD